MVNAMAMDTERRKTDYQNVGANVWQFGNKSFPL